MPLTESTMLSLGSIAPDFSLTDVVTGNIVLRDASVGEKGMLVMFICTHCPYVKHIEAGLAQLGRDYAGKPVSIVAISSNDAVTHPNDSPEGLKRQALTLGFTFPYLYDETQEVAKAYEAACTPDFFLFDAALQLVYRGQFDSSRPGSDIPVTGADLRAAIDSLNAGEPIPGDQRASIGCNIKWKP
jgi:thiol-disulfide isomerase/thioredoxin